MHNNLTFHEINDINDDLLLPWMDLYEMSFPPEEKVLVSVPLGILKLKAQGMKENHHFLATLDESGTLVGIAWYQFLPDSPDGYLWYLAVTPESRSKGFGSAVYNEVVRRFEAEGSRAMMFEVEIPELMQTDEKRLLAERRIGFYKRMGAKLITGIDYVQQVAPHQPPVKMHVMFHSFELLTPDEAFEIAKSLFEDSITRIGDITLEPA